MRPDQERECVQVVPKVIVSTITGGSSMERDFTRDGARL
jgi:hypothetical protein